MSNYLKSAFLLLLVVAFSSCSMTPSSKGTYLIDNPTSEAITVSIDDAEYTIPAESGLDVEIEYGKHMLKYNGQSVTIFAKPSYDDKVIINPTLSNYVLYGQLYITDDANSGKVESFEESYYRNNGDSLTIVDAGDTIRIFAPFKVFNNLFIEHASNSWDFGLNEELPETEVVTTDETRAHFQTSKKKIFREKDFWAFFDDEHQQSLEILSEKKTYNQLPRFLENTPNMDKVQGDKYKQYLDRLMSNFTVWFDKKGEETNVLPVKIEFDDPEVSALREEYKAEYGLDEYSNNNNIFREAVDEYNNKIYLSGAVHGNFLIID